MPDAAPLEQAGTISADSCSTLSVDRLAFVSGAMGRRQTTQTSFHFPRHGGARPGAGRKPRGARAGVKHACRGALGGPAPVLVTMKLLAGLANLRSRRRFRAVLASLHRASERLGSRIVEYSVQSDHIHLVVETRDAQSLARAMQGLAVRLARAR
ncbi:MAG: transposase [Sandaracinus sp.]